MTLEQRPPITITAADSSGIPTHARCPCGWTWERPANDRWADTLTVNARAHPHPPT